MDRSRSTTISALLAALAVVLAACAGSAASPAVEATDTPQAGASVAASEQPTESAGGTGEVRVRIESASFDPEALTVEAGTTVLFLNADGFAHTVTEGTEGQAVDDPIVDRALDQNRTVRVTFDEPGTYEITCKIHPSMHMTITVEG